MSSLITKEMEEILSSLESTEELYKFITNSHKSRDLKSINVGDGKIYFVKMDMKTRDE